MRITALFSFILLCIFSLNAQTFSWTPNDTMIATLSGEPEQFKMEQVNLKDTVINLAIEVVKNEIPSSYDGMLCVYGYCLGEIVDSGYVQEQAHVQAGENGYVRLTIVPSNDAGTFTYRVRVYDVDSPQYSDTATWILTRPVVEDTTDTTESNSIKKINQIKLALYPNPSDDFLFLEFDQPQLDVEILDISGKVIYANRIVSGMPIDIESFNQGTYFLILRDKKGQILSRKQFSKNG